MSESMDEWLARIGSHKAHEERVRERLAGRMNKQFRPVGISDCVKELRWRGFNPKKQPEPRKKPVVVSTPPPPKKQPAGDNHKPMTPPGNKAKNGFKKPARKWDARCSTCAGSGEIIGSRGDRQPCPRCAEE